MGKFIPHPFPVLTLALSLYELWGFCVLDKVRGIQSQDVFCLPTRGILKHKHVKKGRSTAFSPFCFHFVHLIRPVKLSCTCLLTAVPFIVHVWCCCLMHDDGLTGCYFPKQEK